MSEDASAVTVGRLYLDVVASTDGLKADLKAKLEALSRELKVQVKATVVADTAKAKTDIDTVARDRTAKIKADADAARAKADLDAAAKDRTARIQAKADAAKAKADLDAAARERKASIKAVAQNVAAAKAAIDEAAKDRTAKIKTAAQGAAAAKAEIDAVAADRTAKVKAGVLGAAEARAEIDAVAADRTAKIKVKADTENLQATIADIGGTVASIGKGAGIGAGLLDAVGAAGNLAGALVAVAGAASQAVGVIGALPGLLSAAAQGGAAVVLGFSGVSGALKAMTSQQATAGQSAYSMAQAQQGAADRIRTSAQGLAAAQINAVQSVQSAQHNLAQSITGVGDAQYNALQSIAGAEHSLAEAEYGEQQAQVALTQARIDARENLIQTSFALRGAVLGEAQATLNLQAAQIKLTNTMQSVAATPTQRAQAQLDVQQAQLALDQARNSQQLAAAAKAKADKQGVEGSQSVIQAKHAEGDATYSVQQAEQALARDRITNARSLAAAQYQEQQSQQALANVRREAAQQLLNAQITYREALQAAQAPTLSMSSQATALQQALAKLTPAGRTFVEFIHNTVMPQLKTLQRAVQEAFLPGVQKGITAALPILSTVQQGLAGTAGVLGDAAAQFGQQLGSAGSQADLGGVMANNNKALAAFADGGLHAADVVRNLLVVTEPLVLKIAQLADHLAKVVDAESKAGRASGGMAAFFDKAFKSAVLLGKIIDNVFHGLAHIFEAGAPAGTSLLGSLEKATETFADWTGSAPGQAKLKAFFDGTVPVIKQFADLIVHAAKVLGPFLAEMGGGQYNLLFAAFNDILNVLNALVRIPGLGPVVNWILALSLAGVGLGKVAANIRGISDGLKTLSKVTGLSKLFGGAGATEDIAAKNMQEAADTNLVASENMLRAAGMTAAEGDAAAAGRGGAGAAGKGTAGAAGLGLSTVATAAAIGVAGAWIAGHVATSFLQPPTKQQTQDFQKNPTWLQAYEKFFLGAKTASAPTWLKVLLLGAPAAIPLWSTTYEHFQRDFAGKVTAWFTVSLPHVVGAAIPQWFAGAWGWFDRDVVHKVTSFVMVTLPHTFDASIPGWFDSVFGHFQSAVIAPVRGWVMVTLPAYLTSTIPRWFNATWGSFTAHVVNPVRNWMTSTLPAYLTSTIPRWFNSVAGSFTTHVVNPISGFFKTALPGVIEGAFKGGFNWIIGKINGLTSHIPGVGKALQIPALATGGIVPGGYSREDNQLAWVRSGEGVLQPGAVSALGGERFINWANTQFGDIPVGSGGPGHYAGGGLIPNPVNAIVGAAKSAAGIIGSILTDAARLVPGALRSGFDHLWSAAIGPSVNTMAHWGPIGGLGIDGADSLKGAIDSFLGARDAAGTGNIGSGSGADVAKYAASYATGQGHPYVTGGQSPKGWDCSGFTAWVYEHFGYFPGAQKSRWGTSESQFADPRLQSSGPQTGALVFFNDGVYANPGHVGVLINPSSYVGADSPAVGTIISGTRGNVGYRIPKGGFVSSTPAHGMVPANAGAIAAYLASHGFVRNAIAGILGNIWQESGGRPNIPGGLIQILGDAGGSLGSELAKTMQYIAANGSVADINTHAGTPTESAVYFSDKYERPGNPQIQNRIAAANASYAAGYDRGGPVHPGANWLLNGTGRDEWVLVPEAVDMLGGAAAVDKLNQAARLHRAGVAGMASAAAGSGGGGMGSATVNVYPAPRMSEEEVGAVAARKLGMMLAG